jgi:predicted MFS family arabinose efflux permease
VEQLLQSGAAERNDGKISSMWRNPVVWLREQKLSRGFWIFFTAAFFFDFGFAVYAFLFNLYLLDLQFNERAMGLIGGAATLGSVVGTLPAGFLARMTGLRPLLLACFIAAPVLSSFRVIEMREPAQIALAFLAGLAMCLWGVCFLPAIARLTTEQNRASAFSLIFSASIGTATLGGVVCGYLPQWLKMAGITMQPADVKRLILLAACAIAAMGIIAVMRLEMPLTETRAKNEPTGPTETSGQQSTAARKVRRSWSIHPFLLRFLPSMALWTAVVTSFTPFANVYLSRELRLPLSHIGVVFSVAQIVQFAVGLLTPVLFRVLGLVKGIVVTQLMTAVAVGCLAGMRNAKLAVVVYLLFSGMQWMSAPGLYNLVMSKVPDEERSTAAGMTMFCNAVIGSAATAGAGVLFTRFGYSPVLLGIAGLAIAAAGLFRWLVGSLPSAMPT